MIDKCYEKANDFNPDSVLDPNKHNIKILAPFGIRPKACIPSRFALMATKMVTFHAIQNLEFKFTAKTEYQLKFKTGNSGLKFDNDFLLNIGIRQRK